MRAVAIFNSLPVFLICNGSLFRYTTYIVLIDFLFTMTMTL